MCSTLKNFPILEHDNLIAISDRTQTVGNHDACTAALSDIFNDLLFGVCVERARSLIENEHGGIEEKSTRNLKSLSLSATQIGSTFCKDILIPLRFLQISS